MSQYLLNQPLSSSAESYKTTQFYNQQPIQPINQYPPSQYTPSSPYLHPPQTYLPQPPYSQNGSSYYQSGYTNQTSYPGIQQPSYANGNTYGVYGGQQPMKASAFDNHQYFQSNQTIANNFQQPITMQNNLKSTINAEQSIKSDVQQIKKKSKKKSKTLTTESTISKNTTPITSNVPQNSCASIKFNSSSSQNSNLSHSKAPTAINAIQPINQSSLMSKEQKDLSELLTSSANVVHGSRKLREKWIETYASLNLIFDHLEVHTKRLVQSVQQKLKQQFLSPDTCSKLLNTQQNDIEQIQNRQEDLQQYILEQSKKIGQFQYYIENYNDIIDSIPKIQMNINENEVNQYLSKLSEETITQSFIDIYPSICNYENISNMRQLDSSLIAVEFENENKTDIYMVAYSSGLLHLSNIISFNQVFKNIVKHKNMLVCGNEIGGYYAYDIENQSQQAQKIELIEINTLCVDHFNENLLIVGHQYHGEVSILQIQTINMSAYVQMSAYSTYKILKQRKKIFQTMSKKTSRQNQVSSISSSVYIPSCFYFTIDGTLLYKTLLNMNSLSESQTTRLSKTMKILEVQEIKNKMGSISLAVAFQRDFKILDITDGTELCGISWYSSAIKWIWNERMLSEFNEQCVISVRDGCYIEVRKTKNGGEVIQKVMPEKDSFKFIGQIRFDMKVMSNTVNSNMDQSGIYLLGVHKRSREIKLMKIGFNNY